jgi:hypothetical protein
MRRANRSHPADQVGATCRRVGCIDPPRHRRRVPDLHLRGDIINYCITTIHQGAKR